MKQYRLKTGPHIFAWQFKEKNGEPAPDWVKKITHQEHGRTFASTSGRGISVLHDGDYLRMSSSGHVYHHSKTDFESHYEECKSDTYRYRGEVRAWKFYCNVETPKWLIPEFESGAIYYQGGEKPYLTVAMLEGTPINSKVREGDWLIKIGEVFQVLSDQQFQERFEQV